MPAEDFRGEKHSTETIKQRQRGNIVSSSFAGRNPCVRIPESSKLKNKIKAHEPSKKHTQNLKEHADRLE